MSEPVFSILIVNFNGAHVLPACLTSLTRQTVPCQRFEIILVDNASTDGSAEFPAQFRLPIQLIRMATNVGFAQANNVALAAARGAVIVLLNPDTLADPFWLEEIERALTEHPGCAIACKLVRQQLPQQLNSAGLFLLRDGRGADRAFRQPDDGRYESGGDVFAGCAAALAIPRMQLGDALFDARLFLYGEDLELGWRRQLAGLRTVFCARAVVRHAVGASGGDSSAQFWFYTERNRALLALRMGDPMLAITSAVGLFFRAVRAVLFATLGHPAPKYCWANARAVVCAALDYIVQSRHFWPQGR